MGETPMGVGTISTVSFLSIRSDQEQVERCCSCIRHYTCSTLVPSDWVCECHSAGRHYTGCYSWSKCKNKGRLIPSPTTARSLLGNFPREVEPPVVCQKTSPPPVQLPKYLSL